MQVSRSPNGPWQDVDVDESLQVLPDLSLRHILFKVEKQAAAVVDENLQKDGLEHLMLAARRRSFPDAKSRPRPGQ